MENDPISNSIYQEWGLLGALLAVLVALLSLLWWLLRERSELSTSAALQIRGTLASLFQQTVVDAAEYLFAATFDSLTLVLTGGDPRRHIPTAFEKLLRSLQAELHRASTDEIDTIYRGLIERDLIAVIRNEINKLLTAVREGLGDLESKSASPIIPAVGLTGETEHRLTFLAKKTAEVAKQEALVFKSRKRALASFTTCGIVVILLSPSFFIAHWFGYLAFKVLGAISGASFVVGLYAMYSYHRSQSWLDETSKRYRHPEDWIDELYEHRSRS